MVIFKYFLVSLKVPLVARSKMIEMYYTYDESVVREFIGKKLSGKDRRELDDVCEKTRVSMKSCRRQFDNIKRVLKVVDDLNGSLVENVKRQFLLTDSLSQCYAGLVFMSCNKFETGKKKLLHLTVEDFIYCANLMIESWTSGSAGSTRLVDDDLELDKDFLQELHDMKIHLYDRALIDIHQRAVLRDLRRKHHPTWMTKSVEGNFGNLSRNLTSIGSSLIHSKDLKDLFVDVQEKIIEPFKLLKWSKEDMDTVLSSMKETLPDCESSHFGQYGKYFTKDKKKWRVETYLRYLDVLKQAIYVLYH